MLKKILVCFSFLFSFPYIGQNIYTFAGDGNMGFSGDGGPAILGQIQPYSVATDASGNVYILDSGNHRVRKVSSSGIITTIAGTGIGGNSGDGGAAISAQLFSPNGLCVDVSGNIYITDYANSNIRKINSTGIISTITGSAGIGFSGDGGPALQAKIKQPIGITCDVVGNIYFADYGNSRIRKINASGNISTLAGTGTFTYSGDGGPATLAELNLPQGIAIDGANNIYIADFLNSRIRKINGSGIISTIAGTGVNGYSGDGGLATSAKIAGPNNICFDGSGNIYFSEPSNFVIRKINTSGIISTIAGTNISGYSGDGGPATSAKLNYPSGVSIGTSNNIYFSDNNNYRVRVVCASNCLANINSINYKTNEFLIYPNPNVGTIKIQIDPAIEEGEFFLINSLGQKVHKEKIAQGTNDINIVGCASGTYIYTIVQNNQIIKTGKLTIQ